MPQMNVAQGDYLKIAIWWRRNQTFDSERFKSIKEDLSDGGNKDISDCPVEFSPIPRVSHKGSGEGWGTVYTWRV